MFFFGGGGVGEAGLGGWIKSQGFDYGSVFPRADPGPGFVKKSYGFSSMPISYPFD